MRQGAPDMTVRSHLASALWIADGLGAILFAAGLSLSVGALGAGGTPAAWMLAFVLGGALLRALFLFAAQARGQGDAAKIKARWRRCVLPAVLARSLAAPRMLGEEVADATDRIEDLDGYQARFLPLRRAAMVTPLVVAAAVAFASLQSAIILMATLLPFGLGMALAGGMGGRAAARQLEALGRQSGLFVDRVRALPLIRAFGAQARVTRQLDDATRDVARRTVAVLRVSFLSGAVLEFFAALSVALVAVYCGFSLLGLLPFPAPEELTLARALFALALAGEFYLPMRRLAAAYHEKQLGEAALARLSGMSGLAIATPAPLEAAPAIRLRGIVVDYEDRRVGPFDLDVPAGRITALLGPTGIGKSTLLHVLLGLAPPSAGTIEIDGRPMAPGGLRGQASWVGQAVAILPGSLADNLRLVAPHASDAELLRAARVAGLDAMLAARGGLAAMHDAGGSGLSGGERRRIGLARALLRDAPLWLLDEPTADLDRATADAIGRAMLAATAGRTVLLVTHDPQVAALAHHRIILA